MAASKSITRLIHEITQSRAALTTILQDVKESDEHMESSRIKAVQDLITMLDVTHSRILESPTRCVEAAFNISHEPPVKPQPVIPKRKPVPVRNLPVPVQNPMLHSHAHLPPLSISGETMVDYENDYVVESLKLRIPDFSGHNVVPPVFVSTVGRNGSGSSGTPRADSPVLGFFDTPMRVVRKMSWSWQRMRERGPSLSR